LGAGSHFVTWSNSESDRSFHPRRIATAASSAAVVIPGPKNILGDSCAIASIKSRAFCYHLVVPIPVWVTETIRWLEQHLSLHGAAVLVSAVAAILLLLPAAAVRFLALGSITNVYRPWISLSFIVTAAFLIIEKVGFVRHQWVVRSHLENIGTDQINVLLRYVESGKSSISWPISSGAVRDLENKGILYRSSELGNITDGWSYSVAPAAVKFLRPKAFQKLLLKASRKQIE